MIDSEKLKVEKYKDYILIFVIALVACVLYSFEALTQDVNFCPDEGMRYDIPLWIFRNHRLPVGNEPELRSPLWGISYGFSPYFPSLVSVCLMKLVSLFSSTDTSLFLAARFSSVVAGTFTVAIVFLIGRESFKYRLSAVVLSVLVAFLPQFSFLSSYLNNDVYTVFCSAMILLSWIKGTKSAWNLSSCLLLGLGCGILALSYYNGYGWILCSIIYFFVSNKGRKYTFVLNRFAFIFLLVFAIAGWYFIRNIVIYNGDVFGLKTSLFYSEKYAVPKLKPSNRSTYRNKGLSIVSLMMERNWWKLTIRSYFAVFGYMNVNAPGKVYKLYCCILFVGFVNFCIAACKHKLLQKKFIFTILLAGCICIPVLLSLYYSWGSDYQPQGRYIIASLLPVMYFVSWGYDEFDDAFFPFKKKYIGIALCFVWLSLFAFCYKTMFFDIFVQG